MSKERLEINHAIEIIKRETVIAKGLNNSNYNVNLPIDLAVILIEQAERVEGLEEQVDSHISATKRVHKIRREALALKKQNERYQKVLEFYGNKDNYMKYVGMQPITPTIEIDSGKKAREVINND